MNTNLCPSVQIIDPNIKINATSGQLTDSVLTCNYSGKLANVDVLLNVGLCPIVPGWIPGANSSSSTNLNCQWTIPQSLSATSNTQSTWIWGFFLLLLVLLVLLAFLQNRNENF